MKFQGGYLVFFAAILLISCSQKYLPKGYIFYQGRTNAAIYIEEQAIPVVKLAAQELQTHLAAINGVTIPIIDKPSANFKFLYLVGPSALALSKGCTVYPGSESYEVRTGDGFVALVGFDTQYQPGEPFCSDFKDIPAAYQQWDQITGMQYGIPHLALFKQQHPVTKVWEQDAKGTLHAVYQYLDHLGVRWYFPGKLGTIIPKLNSIKKDQLYMSGGARFPVRNLYRSYTHYFMAQPEDFYWNLRLRLGTGADIIGNGEIGHGLVYVHQRLQKESDTDEIYAVSKGVRDRTTYESGKPCLSSKKLYKSHLHFLSKYFETWPNEPAISIMPADSYAELCECNACKGKGTPERGAKGVLSDYVWDYMYNVAVEMQTTHPSKRLSCFAYSSYTLPPTKNIRLPKNFTLGLCYPIDNKRTPQTLFDLEAQHRAWRPRLDDARILLWDYYLYTDSRWGYFGKPVIFTKYIKNEINALSSIGAFGKFIEISHPSPDQPKTVNTLAFDHLNIYLTARLLYSPTTDVPQLLDEYYQLCYGNAANEVKNVFDFIENTWAERSSQLEWISDVRQQLQLAARKVHSNSDEYKRISMLIEYCGAH